MTAPVTWQRDPVTEGWTTAWVGNYRLVTLESVAGSKVTWFIDLVWVDPNRSVKRIDRGEAGTLEEARELAIHHLWMALLNGWTGENR